MTVSEAAKELKVEVSAVVSIINDNETLKEFLYNKGNIKLNENESIEQGRLTVPGVKAIKEALEKNPMPKPTKEPTEKPKRKRRTKAEMEAAKVEKPKKTDIKIKVDTNSPFMTPQTIKTLPIGECRKLVIKQGLLPLGTLAYTSDEAVYDIICAKFVGVMKDNQVTLYKRDNL